MNLNPFRKQTPQTEITPAPAPVDPLQAAIVEEERTSALVREASEACKLLDEEKKSWDLRRGAAQKNLERQIGLHLYAKDAVAKLTAQPVVAVASGSVMPRTVPTGAVLSGEN